MIMRPALTSGFLLLASVAAGCGPGVTLDFDAGRRDAGGVDGAVSDAETPPGCGDGRRLTPETCDDGNLVAGDGCSPVCTVERGWACDGSPVRCHSNCGDGIVAGDEECDDRNTRPNDGCNTACGEEPGYSCAGEPSVCEMGCGDGTISGTEDCDDGNADPDDGCSVSCRVEAGWECMGTPSTCGAAQCGDGLVRGTEACDDGSTVPGDGCSATCTVEPGFACDEEPSVCVSGCGDGVIGASETCDDGGGTAGDGCSTTCRVESGWSCVGAPSECTPVCGDGIVTGGEGCDDDNLTATDGCSATCLVERGFACVGTMPSVCGATCGDAIVASSEGCDDGDADAGDGCGASCEIEFAFGCTGEPSVCLQTDRAVAVALGETSGCVRTLEGRARCWGGNLRGEVGDGTQVTRFMPVTAAVDQVIDLDVGAEFACAVRMNGEVWCWGDHRSKQQGPGIPATIMAVPSPGPLPGLASIVAISTGGDHACALDDAGAVWCWGANGRLQLGRGGTGTMNDPMPTAVTISGPATQVACGGRHTCVVLAGSGAVECWGDDTGTGQLGDGGSNTSQSLPVGVIGLTGIAQVAAGDRHTCARSSLGDVWCWGDNADGQLGNGATVDASTPVAITLPGAATWITAGDAHTCALVGGAAYCWGRNVAGQLGDTTRLPSRTPIAAAALPGGATLVQLDAGALGTCGVTSTGQRYCWGQGDDAQLGILPATPLTPVAVSLSGTIARISGTRPREHATYCASRADGTVACWGSNDTSLLFDSSSADASTPREMAPALSGVLELGMGADFACARTATEVQCWGDGGQLQLGQGSSTTDHWSPTAVMSLAGASVAELAVGELFACVRMTTGEVRCWGDSAGRQVGLDRTADSGIPTAIPDVSGATSIAAGEDHACAVVTGGEVRCWGDDNQGQLGDGSPSGQRPDADPVMMLPPATQVALGRDHSCALLASGAVHCWGENGLGQVGDGGTTDRSAPRVVGGLTDVVQIAAGWDHTCARRSDGTVACWGAGAHGQLGSAFTPSGTTTWATSPVELVGVSGALDVSATATSTCVRDAGGVRCVGFYSFGQLGAGDTLRPLTALAAPL